MLGKWKVFNHHQQHHNHHHFHAKLIAFHGIELERRECVYRVIKFFSFHALIIRQHLHFMKPHKQPRNCMAAKFLGKGGRARWEMLDNHCQEPVIEINFMLTLNFHFGSLTFAMLRTTISQSLVK
jgi:hypothetical protein